MPSYSHRRFGASPRGGEPLQELLRAAIRQCLGRGAWERGPGPWERGRPAGIFGSWETLALAVVIVMAVLTVGAASVPPSPAAGETASSEQQKIDLGSPAAPATAGQSASPSLFLLTLQMLAALAFVLAVIVLVAWLAKKYVPAARRAAAGPDAISILSVRSLGPRRSLIVVRVRGRCLLLGSTPSAITRLADLDMPPGAGDEEGAASSFDAELAMLTSGKPQ